MLWMNGPPTLEGDGPVCVCVGGGGGGELYGNVLSKE